LDTLFITSLPAETAQYRARGSIVLEQDTISGHPQGHPDDWC